MLGLVVGRQPVIAIHVVFADIQAGCDLGI